MKAKTKLNKEKAKKIIQMRNSLNKDICKILTYMLDDDHAIVVAEAIINDGYVLIEIDDRKYKIERIYDQLNKEGE